jgi:hypothetical protein
MRRSESVSDQDSRRAPESSSWVPAVPAVSAVRGGFAARRGVCLSVNAWDPAEALQRAGSNGLLRQDHRPAILERHVAWSRTEDRVVIERQGSASSPKSFPESARHDRRRGWQPAWPIASGLGVLLAVDLGPWASFPRRTSGSGVLISASTWARLLARVDLFPVRFTRKKKPLQRRIRPSTAGGKPRAWRAERSRAAARRPARGRGRGNNRSRTVSGPLPCPCDSLRVRDWVGEAAGLGAGALVVANRRDCRRGRVFFFDDAACVACRSTRITRFHLVLHERSSAQPNSYIVAYESSRSLETTHHDLLELRRRLSPSQRRIDRHLHQSS